MPMEGYVARVACIAAFAFIQSPALEGEGERALFPASGALSFIERADFRRYEGGKFVGVEYRETRGILTLIKSSDGGRFSGTFFELEGIAHEGGQAARKVVNSQSVSYTIKPDGTVESESGGPYPTLRGFPVLPTGALSPGDAWKAPGERFVAPLNDGKYTRIKFLCEYRLDANPDGRSSRTISARYAVRYTRGEDPDGDPRLVSASGTHDVSIQLAESSDAVSFMRDTMDETYGTADGASITLKGFILTWFNSAIPINRDDTAAKLAETLKKSGAPDVEVTENQEGVSVSLSNIRFVAEEATVLPQEFPRLASLAKALGQISGRTFLVIGHAARVGTKDSQMELSVRRAKAVVDYLVSQGIPADRFLYEGRGGTEPIAPNDTEENMAKNRRVEIKILED
jgi:OOP family OmpA-OmpF porin